HVFTRTAKHGFHYRLYILMSCLTQYSLLIVGLPIFLVPYGIAKRKNIFFCYSVIHMFESLCPYYVYNLYIT
ncbi:hypothetical protein L9F63_016589, partial [Diploptera punctata]